MYSSQLADSLKYAYLPQAIFASSLQEDGAYSRISVGAEPVSERKPMHAKRDFAGATAVSILLFSETWTPSGIFLKKMPSRMIFKWQHLNRNRSKTRVDLIAFMARLKLCPFKAAAQQSLFSQM